MIKCYGQDGEFRQLFAQTRPGLYLAASGLPEELRIVALLAMASRQPLR